MREVISRWNGDGVFTGREPHASPNKMAYSIASGRYFYEEGGDYFSFNALIDKMDHSGA